MPDVFLYPGEANPSDVRLRDQSAAGGAAPLVSNDADSNALAHHWARIAKLQRIAADYAVVFISSAVAPVPYDADSTSALQAHWARARQRQHQDFGWPVPPAPIAYDPDSSTAALLYWKRYNARAETAQLGPPAAAAAFPFAAGDEASFHHRLRNIASYTIALEQPLIAPAIPPPAAPWFQQEVWPLHHWLAARQWYCAALEPACTFFPDLNVDLGEQPPLTPPVGAGARTSRGHGFWLKPGPWLFSSPEDPLPPFVDDGAVYDSRGNPLELWYLPVRSEGAAAEAEQQQREQHGEAEQYVLGTDLHKPSRAPAKKECPAEQAVRNRRAIAMAEAARRRHTDEEELLLLLSL